MREERLDTRKGRHLCLLPTPALSSIAFRRAELRFGAPAGRLVPDSGRRHRVRRGTVERPRASRSDPNRKLSGWCEVAVDAGRSNWTALPTTRTFSQRKSAAIDLVVVLVAVDVEVPSRVRDSTPSGALGGLDRRS